MLDLVFFGPKGVVVTTEGFQDIEVTVVSKEAAPKIVGGKKCLGKGTIQIGEGGVEVGNIIMNSIYEVPYQSGLVTIEVWEDESLQYPISVIFVLDNVQTIS